MKEAKRIIAYCGFLLFMVLAFLYAHKGDMGAASLDIILSILFGVAFLLIPIQEKLDEIQKQLKDKES